MKLPVLFVASFAAAFAFVYFVIVPRSAQTGESPTHVAAVYVDGLSHSDFRQSCSTIHAPGVFPTMAACEGYFAYGAAVMGAAQYRVVPHSAKVWTQKYKGRSVRLAVVKYKNLTAPYTAKAHLRWINGAWRIVGVS